MSYVNKDVCKAVLAREEDIRNEDAFPRIAVYAKKRFCSRCVAVTLRTENSSLKQQRDETWYACYSLLWVEEMKGAMPKTVRVNAQPSTAVLICMLSEKFADAMTWRQAERNPER